jgi:hypothetical protein
VIPPPNDGVLQYPIYDTDKAWTSNLFRLKPLADHHREMLHEMQPFASNSDASYLGWINRLARIDRHRRLSIMTSYLPTSAWLSHCLMAASLNSSGATACSAPARPRYCASPSSLGVMA